ncbi:hypothetical protein ALC62_05105 [Cyphomyrmex costatus]|uniref:Uncharacterized protein n=1 Tax=Cyphomyrmex costatus TaxID=456900 RepID=A0A195CW07_9HYME|nr:hypothetical protein ALC62_05105 [Cyphomyrmex costatus]
MTRTEKERQEGRPEPDSRLRSNKDGLLLYERDTKLCAGASRGPLGPTLHRLVRLILSGKQTSGSREFRCE